MKTRRTALPWAVLLALVFCSIGATALAADEPSLFQKKADKRLLESTMGELREEMLGDTVGELNAPSLDVKPDERIDRGVVGMAEIRSAMEKVSLSRDLFTYGDIAIVNVSLNDDLLRVEGWAFSDGTVEKGRFCAAGDHAIQYSLALKDAEGYALDVSPDMLRGEIPFTVQPIVINLLPLSYPEDVTEGASIDELDLNEHFQSPVSSAVLGWTDSGMLDAAYRYNLFSYSLFDADTMTLLDDTGNYIVVENLVSIVALAKAEPVAIAWQLYRDGAFVDAFDGTEPMPSYEEHSPDPYTYTVVPEFYASNGVTPTPSQYDLTQSSFGTEGIHTVALALRADGTYALSGGAENETASFTFGIVATAAGEMEQPEESAPAPQRVRPPRRPRPYMAMVPGGFYTYPGDQPQAALPAAAIGAIRGLLRLALSVASSDA